MNLTVETGQFTDTEAPELEHYRPVNRWAVLSLILGLLSAATLIHPALLFIPLAALITGLVALSQLSSPETVQTGIGAARAGVFLSLLFAFWTITQTAYQRRAIDEQGRAFAMKWLELVRDGKRYEAHQLTLAEESREPPGTDLALHYAYRERKISQRAGEDEPRPEDMLESMNAMPHEAFNAYFSMPTVNQIGRLSGNAKIEFVSSSDQIQLDPYTVSTKQSFRITDEQDGQKLNMNIVIELERIDADRVAVWRVLNVIDGTK